MSAFICNNYHISVVAAYGARFAYISDPETSQLISNEKLGQILYNENLKSVNYRYREDKSADFEFDDRAIFRLYSYSSLQIVKACHCLSYQSCEHPEWNDSLARRLLDKITYIATTKVRGYEDLVWEIDFLKV